MDGRWRAGILAPMRGLALTISLLALAACEPAIPEGRFACDNDGDCPHAMVCRTNVHRCFSTLADAGEIESGSDAGPTRDAGPTDAGASDAGSTFDGGAIDASSPDAAAPLDASAASDAATVDAGSTHDGGAIDASSSDAAAPLDASPDAG